VLWCCAVGTDRNTFADYVSVVAADRIVNVYVTINSVIVLSYIC